MKVLFFRFLLPFVFLVLVPQLSYTQGKVKSPDQRTKVTGASVSDKELIDSLLPQIETLNFDQLITLAKAQINTNDMIGASSTLDVAEKGMKKPELVSTLRAKCLALQKKEKEALILLRNVIEQNPTFEPAYVGIADIFEARPKTDKIAQYELRTIYLDLLQKVGERSRYLSRLCTLTYEENLIDQAKQYCARATKINPRDESNFIYLSKIFFDTGDLSAAEKQFSQMVNKFPKSAIALHEYGKYLMTKKDFSAAKSYLEKSVIADEKRGPAWLDLANTNYSLQKFPDALLAFKVACKLSPELTLTRIRSVANNFIIEKKSEWATKFKSAADSCGVLPLFGTSAAPSLGGNKKPDSK